MFMRAALFFFASLICIETSATRAVHITGTIANIQSWEIKGYYTAIVVSSTELPARGTVSTRPQLIVDRKTGHFSGELPCEVIRNNHSQWVDLHLVLMNVTFNVRSEMVIRVPNARTVELGTFDWKPSRYLWKSGSPVIDTAVPRDTVVGDRFGDHMRISPINPTPSDTMRIEFVWHNNGAPFESSHSGFYMKDCCTVLIDFTFAVRSDVDVHNDSWSQHARPFTLQGMAAGRHRLRQVTSQGENLRDVDFLLGKDLYFTVRERSEP